jgi:hypothetical protein
MKNRNPKAENRKKPEARMPKPEGVKSGFSIQNDYALEQLSFRISGFGILSGFGFRVSDLSTSLMTNH